MKKHLAVLIGMVLLLSALICVPARAAVFVDADNDGIPDEVEIAWNLDPNNANDRWTIAANGYSYVANYVLGLEPTESPTLVIKVGATAENLNADTTDLVAALDQAINAGGPAIVKIQAGEYLLEYVHRKFEALGPKVMVSGAWNEDFTAQSSETPTILNRTSWHNIFFYDNAKSSAEGFVFEWLTFQGGGSESEDYGILLNINKHTDSADLQAKVLISWCTFTSKTEISDYNHYELINNGNIKLRGTKWVLVSDTLSRGCRFGSGLYIDFSDSGGYYQVFNTTIEANGLNIAFIHSSGRLQLINSIIWYWGSFIDAAASRTEINTVNEGFQSAVMKDSIIPKKSKTEYFENLIMSDPVIDKWTGQLQPGSPAVGVGSLDGASPVDLLGNPREKPDIGCMQRTFSIEAQQMIARGIIEQSPQAPILKAVTPATTPSVKMQIKRVSSKLLGKDGGVQLFFVNQATGKYYYVDVASKTLVTKPVTRAFKLKPTTWDLSSYVPKLPKGKFTANIKAFKKVSGKMKQFYWTNQVFNR